MINYGNGVSIDTDDVTYIENGPNYHTYTFNIIREGAPANAPLENLVLTPLPDGSYKELLITYHLTPQEKQALMMGASVDTKGKTSVTELAKGSYNTGGQLARFNCGYESTTVWVDCCHNGFHNPTNVDDWVNCVCPQEGKPYVYTVVSYVCKPVNETIAPTDPGGSGGGGGGGSACTDCPPGENIPTDPCNGNGVLTGPQDPIISPGNGGCGGVVTTPTLPLLSADPCRKTKASITAANNVLKNPDVQSQMDAVLKGKRNLENEWGTAIGLKNDGSYDITPAVEQQQSTGNSPDDLLSNPNTFFADGHTHSGDPGKPSAGDLYGMLDEIFFNANFKYRYVYGDSDLGTPEVYALVLNDRNAAIQFRAAYPESENYDIEKHGFLKDSKLGRDFENIKSVYNKLSTVNTSGEDHHPKAVAMAYILEALDAGISLAKVDNNGELKKINVALEEITNPDGTKTQRAKVSKCP